MAIIASTVASIKSDPLALLGGAERVNQCFAAVGHVWRDRLLNPANTLALFMLQVLNANTAISHLPFLCGRKFASSSYCDARQRLPVAGVAAVVEELSCNASRCNQSASTWQGRRVLMCDATSATTADNGPLQKMWPQPSEQNKGCGFPVIKLLALMDLATGMIVQMTLMALNVHEMSQLGGLHGAVKAGDVLLGDRAFCSFGHLVLLGKMAVDAVFRMHQRQIVDFTAGRGHRDRKKKHKRGMPTSRFVRRLGDEDQIVEWTRPTKRPSWMSVQQFAEQPEVILVRELRYRINARGMRTREVTIATTLLDPVRYSKREIARLYNLRWEIEINFRHLKTTMKMDRLKCHTTDGAIKELMVFALVYNLIRAVMNRAAKLQGTADANRISFVDAQRFLCAVINVPATGEMPELIVNPARPGRWHPRVLKRRIKEYDLMNKPREQYCEPSVPAEVRA
jgi:hypothetical protein